MYTCIEGIYSIYLCTVAAAASTTTKASSSTVLSLSAPARKRLRRSGRNYARFYLAHKLNRDRRKRVLALSANLQSLRVQCKRLQHCSVQTIGDVVITRKLLDYQRTRLQGNLFYLYGGYCFIATNWPARQSCCHLLLSLFFWLFVH